MRKLQNGALHQLPDGSFELRRADGSTKSVSEFEAKRFLTSAVERSMIEEMLSDLETLIGCKLPEKDRRAMAERVHKQGRKTGVLRTGSVATKLFENE